MKDYQEQLWEQWMDEESGGGVQVFAVEVDGKVGGWMTPGMESWNNRLRIHEFWCLSNIVERVWVSCS